MTAKERLAKAERLWRWWESLRPAPVRSQGQPTKNEVMLERLRVEFALEPVTRFPRAR